MRAMHPIVLCNVCEQGQFYTDRALESHIAAKHPNQCKQAYCKRRIDTHAGWKFHWLFSRHHPTCKICKEGFRDFVEFSKVRSLRS